MNYLTLLAIAGDTRQFFLRLVFLVPAIIIAISFHEFAHALSAYMLGDDTPKHDGRLTLNPLKSIDPIGLVMLILFHFGWSKPVEFNPKNFKRPRLYQVLTALAGPFSNLILAVIAGRLLKFLSSFHGFALPAMKLGTIQYFFANFLLFLIVINIGLMIFNLLPFPPLDGGHLVIAIFNLSDETQYKLSRYGFIILIMIMFADNLVPELDLIPIGDIVMKISDFILS